MTEDKTATQTAPQQDKAAPATPAPAPEQTKGEPAVATPPKA